MSGFECEFVEKPLKAFQSEFPICLLVLREPYQATCCGKSFCKECIHRIKAANQACPTCNEKDFTLSPNKGLQQPLYDFRVYCTHKSEGCEWTGELRELDNHLNSDPPADKSLQGCPYTLINCPLDCTECVKGVYRKDVKTHINDRLLIRVVMQNTQIESLKHQLQGISARFEKINEDKEIIEQRVGELETKVSELNVQNGELKSEIEALKVKQPEIVSEGQPISEQPPIPHVTGTIKPMGAKFIMTDFEEWRKDSDVWFSPHFYTHPNGYKMCLRIDANGIGSGRGTHLSVFVYLMQGNFDDQLEWPFQGNITFKLVNQEEDRDHAIKTVYSRRAPSDRLERVTTKGRIDNPWGINNFLPHAELQPKYLKNDRIKLCIKSIEFH